MKIRKLKKLFKVSSRYKHEGQPWKVILIKTRRKLKVRSYNFSGHVFEKINFYLGLAGDFPEPECKKCGRIIYCGASLLCKEKDCGLNV